MKKINIKWKIDENEGSFRNAGQLLVLCCRWVNVGQKCHQKCLLMSSFEVWVSAEFFGTILIIFDQNTDIYSVYLCCRKMKTYEVMKTVVIWGAKAAVTEGAEVYWDLDVRLKDWYIHLPWTAATQRSWRIRLQKMTNNDVF